MHTKRAGHLLAAVFLGLAVGCQDDGGAQRQSQLGTQEAKAETDCVEQFEGITSCALGNASLSSTGDGLEVSELHDPDEDGVSSNFDGAVYWTQEVAISHDDSPGRFSLAARDGDQVVSTLRVTRDEEDPSLLRLSPTFTGGALAAASYRVNVYQDGVPTGGTGGTTGDFWVRLDDLYWVNLPWDFFFFLTRTASPEQPAEGACVWRLRSREGTFTAVLNGQEVTGDAIEVVEEIQDGAYPYTSFSGIDVKAEADSYTILSESISRE